MAFRVSVYKLSIRPEDDSEIVNFVVGGRCCVVGWPAYSKPICGCASFYTREHVKANCRTEPSKPCSLRAACIFVCLINAGALEIQIFRMHASVLFIIRTRDGYGRCWSLHCRWSDIHWSCRWTFRFLCRQSRLMAFIWNIWKNARVFLCFIVATEVFQCGIKGP